MVVQQEREPTQWRDGGPGSSHLYEFNEVLLGSKIDGIFLVRVGVVVLVPIAALLTVCRLSKRSPCRPSSRHLLSRARAAAWTLATDQVSMYEPGYVFWYV